MPSIFYGWVVVACAFTVLFLTYGVQYSFGVFVPAMIDDLGWSRAGLGAAFSLYGMVYMTVTMLAGKLTDAYGPGRVISIGGVLLGVGIMATSRISAPWQIYFWYGIVAALGMSTAYIPCNMTVVRWFLRRRGLAVGVSSCGASCGILVVPVLVMLAIESLDWRTAMFGCGAALLVVTIIAARFMTGSPAHMGLVPDGGGAPDPAFAVPCPVPTGDPDWTFRRARTTPVFWLFVVGFALALLTMTVPFVHIAGFARDLELADVEAAAAVSTVGLFALIGGLGLGGLSDRIGPKAALMIGLAAQLVAYAVLHYAADRTLLFAGAAAFGIFYGSFVAMFPALVADLFGPAHAGTIAGVIVGGGGILGAWGPAAVGYLRDLDGDYHRGFSYCFLTAVATLGWFALLRRPRPSGYRPGSA